MGRAGTEIDTVGARSAPWSHVFESPSSRRLCFFASYESRVQSVFGVAYGCCTGLIARREGFFFLPQSTEDVKLYLH